MADPAPDAGAEPSVAQDYLLRAMRTFIKAAAEPLSEEAAGTTKAAGEGAGRASMTGVIYLKADGV